MIHVFHGFLGSPSDFSYLKNDNVIFHDLYEMNNYPEVNEDDIMIGYSMGGRVALDIAKNIDFRIKKVILISSHPGLNTDAEKKERKKFEEIVIQNLKTMDKKSFLTWWNSLPLFHSDEPIFPTSERYSKSVELFEKYRLSNQANHLPDISKHKDKFLYVAGGDDEKYKALATDVFLTSGIRVKIISGGHRLFQRREEILNVLNEEGIL